VIPVSLLILLVSSAAPVSCESKETGPGGKAPADGALRSAPLSQEVEPSPSGKDAPKATRVVLLGSGTPVPDPRRSGPAVVVLSRGRSYLIDFGPGVVRRATLARERGLRELDILNLTRVFVTHLHSDHTAGYPDLIFTPAVVGRVEPLRVYGPPGIRKMTEALQEAFRADFETRSRSEDPRAMRGYSVESHEVKPGRVYRDDAVEVSAFKVDHGAWEEAYGYRFETPDRSIVISGDTRPTDAVVEACNGCDVLVHEVYCEAGFDRTPPNLQRYHSSHHTSTVELARIAQKARPELLVLYHLLFFGCSEEQLVGEVRREYRGRVALGQDLAVY
jgi:ribonuclease Z